MSDEEFDHGLDLAIPADEPLGSGDFVVAEGKCFFELGAKLGMSGEELAGLGENAELAEARALGCLLRGDRVTLPSVEGATFTIAMDTRHTFVLKIPVVQIEMRVLHHGLPQADRPAKLTIAGTEYPDKTDTDGWFRVEIPATAQRGSLEVQGLPEPIVLEFGRLAPEDHVRGLQGRLANLGLYAGRIDGAFGPLSNLALAAFGLAYDIPDAASSLERAVQVTRDVHG